MSKPSVANHIQVELQCRLAWQDLRAEVSGRSGALKHTQVAYPDQQQYQPQNRLQPALMQVPA